MPAPIHTLALNLTARCNARCLHCTYWRQDAPQAEIEDFAPLYRAIEDGARHSPGLVIAFTGGEPFLVPELFPLIRHAKAQAAGKVIVTTNGLALPDARVAELCETGLDELLISLDGFEATHDRLRGVPGAFRRARRLIESVWARPKRPLVLAMATISAANLAEFRDFATFLRDDPRVARTVLQAVTQPMPAPAVPRWQDESDLWPRDLNSVDALFDWLIAHRDDLRIHNGAAQLATMKRYFHEPDRLVWRSCNVGTRYLNVLTDGRVLNCIQRPPIGNIRRDRIPDMLASAETAAQVAEMESCRRNCHFLVNCGFVEGELA
jgi:MoaA/NifB/PqqE/SkfB family radical SAM enzyme